MLRARLAVLSLMVASTFGAGGVPPSAAFQADVARPFVPDEVLLKFRPAARSLDRASARAQLRAAHMRTFRGGAEHWKLGSDLTVAEAVERLRRNPLVEYAEPNYVLHTHVVPNDPRLGELYGMVNTGQTGGTPDADIDADMAWNVSRGSRSVVVAVIDTGVDYNHPDLAANIWTNADEVPGNGVDDDLNGYVDDVHGYDWVNNDGDPFDDNGHGTHCAGTIGAVGNNGVGVAGVNWEVSIMALKFLSGSGSGSTANAVLAVDYATANGAHLSSNSWGGGGFSQTLLDAIRRASTAEIPFVAAAGNNGTNNDTGAHYPSNYDVANIISVAATDHNDNKASFSNYGLTSVDLGAPGVNILSTQPGGGYRLLSGTSMATPHVAGAAALVKSLFPAIPAAQLKTALLTSVTPIAALRRDGPTPVATGGRLNAFFAIAAPDDVAPGAVTGLVAGEAGSNHMALTWTATGDDGDSGTAAFYQVRFSTAPIDEANFNAAARAGNEPDPQPAGSTESMEVRGLSADTTYYFAVKAFDEFGNAGPISNVAVAATLPPPTVGLAPASIEEALRTGQTADHTVMLRNDGVGTLDFTIAPPALGEPTADAHEPLVLDKDQEDPRPGIFGSGGPDAFGYRWSDSNQPGGPVFAWTDISGTGTLVADVTTDDDTSAPIALGFDFPFYGSSFDSIRVSSNGWLSFTSTSTAYSNQPLPNSGAPENLVAPFWDDLNPGGVARIYFQTLGSRAIVQWHQMPRYAQAGSSLTFQAVLESSGSITFQYLSLTGTLDSGTVGIQDASRTIGLTTAFQRAYVQDNLAVRYTALPQWLTVAPTSGRIPAGGSVPLAVHVDATGLDGGTYPGTILVATNDPLRPTVALTVTLTVTGAPDAVVNPSALGFGDRFVGVPHILDLTIANVGTDTLHVSGVDSGHPDVSVSPSSFDVPAHGLQTVAVRWHPAALGPLATSLVVRSDDAETPAVSVPVSGQAIPVPVVAVDPTRLAETLFSGAVSTRLLVVSNGGGSDLVVSAAADQGNGGSGIVGGGEAALGNGGPDAFGYRWRDSDAAGGPAFDFVDIGATGTPITFTSQDNALSAAIPIGLDFPFYGNTFSAVKVSTNGWLTFDLTATATASSNGNLPSTSLPPNSVALFWDDLHVRTGSVRYLNDGTRFILQYTGVGRFSPSSGQSYTFQVQLYRNGRILLQYASMTGTLNSATIGIQNQTRGVALPVSVNTAYVHQGLALRISRTPDWLSVSPAGSTVPPGQQREFTVTFNATDRPGGRLEGAVVLGTNAPGQATVVVPAALDVIGAPQIALVPASLGYGTVFVGYPQVETFQVINNGTEDLNVSAVTTTDPSLMVEETPGPTASFRLAPGAARVMSLRWSPTAVGALDARVEVASDDPDTPVAPVRVTGHAIPAPVLAHSPASFTESLAAGTGVTRRLRIENQGGSDLDFSTSLRLLGGTPVMVHPEMELAKEEDDPRPGLLGSGGPDLFGYRWRDSDSPGGPTFSFVDISSTGTPLPTLTGDDQDAGPVPIGFSFPFYGKTFNTVRVKTNGFLSFTSTLTDTSNDPLPSTSAPPNLLAVFWDDLHFRGVARARYLNDGGRFIVQWTEVDRFSTTEQPSPARLTFQAILYPNGRIVYQYATMAGFLGSATIGIQNETRNDGQHVVFNAAYVHDNLAIEIRPRVDFLSVTPPSGTVPAGGAADLDVRIDATFLIGGDYATSIDVISNDPARGFVPVPVNLHVTGIPDAELVPGALAFPPTFLGFGSTLPLTVKNVGTDVLTVTGASLDGDFTQTGLTTPVSIAVGASVTASVRFTPSVAALRTATLTLTTDDPDEGVIVVPLEGLGVVPPRVGVAPATIHTALPPGGSRTKTLTVANSGGSDLHWTTGTEIVSAPPEGDLTTLGSGGPDAFGYRWRDSDAPSGPAFGFVDIRATGTPISFSSPDSGVSAAIGLGMQFPFYGGTFNALKVSTNGWLTFDTAYTGASVGGNGNLPSTILPRNSIAMFWDDLHLRSGDVRYLNDGGRFILQFTNVGRFTPSTGQSYTFQVHLYADGRILLQYLSMTGTLTSATIGIQDQTRTVALAVNFNTAYAHDNLAVQFKSIPLWVQLSPAGGTVAPGSVQEVIVSVDAAGLEDGLHEATVTLSSNDPYAPQVTVPMTVNVGLVAPTMIDFDPDRLNLASRGRCVKVVVELPAGLDPRAVRLSSLTLNDAVAYPPDPCGPVSYGDSDLDGIEEISIRFDRAAVEAILPVGEAIPLTIQGEVADVQWFRGTTAVRTIRPGPRP